ncbi:acyltransferase family protein [Roseateles sp. BYS78W]|uniref:Acyltransferase family protein n=1 Tax=Pelomonas candidula TaxID=3299025 RepID=A0ABW7HC63_9BURK
MSIRSNVRLSEVIRSRDNNLNLIRFIAATMVLVSHSFALHTGDPGAEPWRKTLGMSMGGVAVDIFFCASGFLVTGSLLASRSIRDFLLARALRIYPGLWTALLLSVVAVGIFASTESAGRFFSAYETWKYLLRNAVMVIGAEFQLPGAFAGNPFNGAVNGSLWTLPFELRAYLIVLGLWLIAVWKRGVAAAAFKTVVMLACAVTLVWAIGSMLAGQPNRFAALLAVFLLGALLRLIADRVVLSRWALVALLALLVGSLLLGTKVFWLVYIFILPYALLCLAYLPAGVIRKFNGVGDYSYGIYIYMPSRSSNLSLQTAHPLHGKWWAPRFRLP